MDNIWIVLLPALLTILGNLIFYLFIKGRIDNAIEKQKIAYSGIFKERIDIYRELLSKIYNIKLQIQRYQYFGTDEDSKNIIDEINNFINFYIRNQPFLSIKMIDQLTKMRVEFQDTFDKFFIFHRVGIKHSENEERKSLLDDYFKAGNKFKTNQPFQDLEDTIIAEMRKDLQTDR